MLFGILPVYAVIAFLCFIPAIVIHEVSHGFVAHLLGDPTAKKQGRLSLNPLSHIDPFGTVVLPLILAFVGGPVFGYAKPVPYNPSHFKNVRVGELLTGLAGPASNIIMAALTVVIAYLVATFAPQAPFWLFTVFYYFIFINLVLAFFNLIPLPPLDGASIIALFLPDKALRQYYQIQQYALPILLILMFMGPYIFGFNPISVYLGATAGNLADWAFSLVPLPGPLL
ncbi:MAG: site-2 protease family protein [Coriobacteriia bacterium]|jgi:Zn-dependent protease|nr:site-2 protease family protein [Coriobacteriia bacterium]MDR2715040.1 site-2 protease family protein [Coriobacteriales bacterium]